MATECDHFPKIQSHKVGRDEKLKAMGQPSSAEPSQSPGHMETSQSASFPAFQDFIQL